MFYYKPNDIKMEKLQLKASFKDENDDVFFVKRLPLKTKIQELLAINKTDTLWIELEFKDLKLLEHVELFGLDLDKFRVTFNYRIEQFGPDNTGNEGVWQDISDYLYHQVWSHEDAIMNLFGVNEVSVLHEYDWNNPPKVVSNLEITVAHLKSTHYISVELQISLEQLIEIDELTFFHDKARDMESLINKMLLYITERLNMNKA